LPGVGIEPALSEPKPYLPQRRVRNQQNGRVEASVAVTFTVTFFVPALE
jgi:hypothetical protein